MKRLTKSTIIHMFLLKEKKKKKNKKQVKIISQYGTAYEINWKNVLRYENDHAECYSYLFPIDFVF